MAFIDRQNIGFVQGVHSYHEFGRVTVTTKSGQLFSIWLIFSQNNSTIRSFKYSSTLTIPLSNYATMSKEAYCMYFSNVLSIIIVSVGYADHWVLVDQLHQHFLKVHITIFFCGLLTGIIECGHTSWLIFRTLNGVIQGLRASFRAYGLICYTPPVQTANISLIRVLDYRFLMWSVDLINFTQLIPISTIKKITNRMGLVWKSKLLFLLFLLFSQCTQHQLWFFIWVFDQSSWYATWWYIPLNVCCCGMFPII